jgi:hypothetical protein
MACAYPAAYVPIGSTVVVTFDMTDRLYSGELLTGTPSVEDANATGDLSITNKQINSVAFASEDIAIGKAVQFRISSTTTTEEAYEISITAVSDGVPAQTLTDTMKIFFIE